MNVKVGLTNNNEERCQQNNTDNINIVLPNTYLKMLM